MKMNDLTILTASYFRNSFY